MSGSKSLEEIYKLCDKLFENDFTKDGVDYYKTLVVPNLKKMIFEEYTTPEGRNALLTQKVTDKIVRRYFNEKEFKFKEEGPLKKHGLWILNKLKLIFKLALVLLAEQDEEYLKMHNIKQIKTMEDLFSDHRFLFDDGDLQPLVEREEVGYLCRFVSYLRIAMPIIPGSSNKGILLKILEKLEGSGEHYVTGGEMRKTAKRRWRIIEDEGNAAPVKRPQRPPNKRKLGKGVAIDPTVSASGVPYAKKTTGQAEADIQSAGNLGWLVEAAELQEKDRQNKLMRSTSTQFADGNRINFDDLKVEPQIEPQSYVLGGNLTKSHNGLWNLLIADQKMTEVNEPVGDKKKKRGHSKDVKSPQSVKSELQEQKKKNNKTLTKSNKTDLSNDINTYTNGNSPQKTSHNDSYMRCQEATNESQQKNKCESMKNLMPTRLGRHRSSSIGQDGSSTIPRTSYNRQSSIDSHFTLSNFSALSNLSFLQEEQQHFFQQTESQDNALANAISNIPKGSTNSVTTSSSSNNTLLDRNISQHSQSTVEDTVPEIPRLGRSRSTHSNGDAFHDNSHKNAYDDNYKTKISSSSHPHAPSLSIPIFSRNTSAESHLLNGITPGAHIFQDYKNLSPLPQHGAQDLALPPEFGAKNPKNGSKSLSSIGRRNAITTIDNIPKRQKSLVKTHSLYDPNLAM